MNREELAALVLRADDAGRRRLFAAHPSLVAGASLAYTLKDICLDGWTSDPARARAAADALGALSEFGGDEETGALAGWAGAISALIDGRMELALARLDETEGPPPPPGKAG